MQFLKPFARYFQFSGRAGRAEFWQYMALVMIVAMLLNLMELSATMEAAEMGVTHVPILSTIFSLVTFIPSLAVTFRRLHDRNKSGWYYGWLLVACLPLAIFLIVSSSFPVVLPLAMAMCLGFVAYSIYLIYELAQPGDEYENDYGLPDNEDLQMPEAVNFARAAAPTPRADSSPDVFAQIERLAQLHAQGALTQEEFSAQKSRLLGMM